MSPYLTQLVAKHRSRGILVDTNLLLLYVVGSYRTPLISQFKRTRAYSLLDYRDLHALIGAFSRLLTTPNILTEVCNLADSLDETTSRSLFDSMAKQIKEMAEMYHASAGVVESKCFRLFGMADAVAFVEARSSGCLVLTDDLPLYNYLTQQRLPAINFNHVRSELSGL